MHLSRLRVPFSPSSSTRRGDASSTGAPGRRRDGFFAVTIGATPRSNYSPPSSSTARAAATASSLPACPRRWMYSFFAAHHPQCRLPAPPRPEQCSVGVALRRLTPGAALCREPPTQLPSAASSDLSRTMLRRGRLAPRRAPPDMVHIGREKNKEKERKKATGRDKKEEGEKERKKKGKWKRKIGNKKKIHYLFLEIMIHKLYYLISISIVYLHR
jgi:hypothetical protein